MVKPRDHRVILMLGTAVLVTGTLAWGLAPLLPVSPIVDDGNASQTMARPASWQGDSIADVVEQVEPSVVTITVEQTAQQADARGSQFTDGDFLRQFGGGGGTGHTPIEHSEALGSGFIVDDQGDILTNNHVVDGGTRFTVEFSDKSISQAFVVGTDPQIDLALIHVDRMPRLHALELADSDQLRVGDAVIAIGDPYGVGQTVTSGVVSARGRSLGTSSYVDYIQTDASINQGNSGGPLLDRSGLVVGVNSAIFSPTGGNVGIGFAVPSNTVRTVFKALRQNGKVSRAWLGIGIQDVTPSIAAASGLAKADGAIVTTVDGSGPSLGKLKAGDIVTRFNSVPIREARDLSTAASRAAIGANATVTVLRQGRDQQLTIKMGRLSAGPSQANAERDPAGKVTPRLGLSVAPLDENARASLGVRRDTSGVIVSEVDKDGPSAHSGIRPGGVIERVGDLDVTNAASLVKAIAKIRNDTALLLVSRQGTEGFVAVPLG